MFLLAKYFKFSPLCSGSISGPPFFGVENFQILSSNYPSPLVIYECSFKCGVLAQ